MRIAVVHHWFVTRGGGERVAECIAALFPAAEMFTLVQSPAGTPESLRSRRWHTSFLQRIPLARTHHRHFLPLFPAATESLDLRGFDLVLSSDSGPVKGVRADPGTPHICYCHSPMRYLWDGFEDYRAGMSGLTRAAFSVAAPRVRKWDLAAAQRVTAFIANSECVAGRIRNWYGREATVINPPIDLHRAAAVAGERPGEHYLCAGRLVSYKRTDILIAACRQMGRRLRVAGTGPELARLQALAGGDPLIEFLGELPTPALWREFAHCRALLFAAEEDFGMIPLEAQACGRPVIAFGRAGSLETVRGRPGVDRPTGAFFLEQTSAAVAAAIEEWERDSEARFRSEDAHVWAARFATPHFLERYRAFVLDKVPAAAADAISPEAAMVVLA